MTEAAFYEPLENGRVHCHLCPHECVIASGHRGRCRVRENRAGTLVGLTYGQVAALLIDPIEKKPLYHFHPGTTVLSAGTWGCNLNCAFCQNCELSMGEVPTHTLAAEDLAHRFGGADCLGVAYTYNEPSIWFEYIRDCAPQVHALGGKNVMVSNGFINPEPLAELLPHMDAINIDLKGFGNDFYRIICGGSLQPVLHTIEKASRAIHVEITTLVIPGHNDSREVLEHQAEWIAKHAGASTPLHLSAYHPAHKFTAPPTPPERLLVVQELFRQYLHYVYIGNVPDLAANHTQCPHCQAIVIQRTMERADASGMTSEGACAHCGTDCGMVT